MCVCICVYIIGRGPRREREREREREESNTHSRRGGSRKEFTATTFCTGKLLGVGKVVNIECRWSCFTLVFGTINYSTRIIDAFS